MSNFWDKFKTAHEILSTPPTEQQQRERIALLEREWQSAYETYAKLAAILANYRLLDPSALTGDQLLQYKFDVQRMDTLIISMGRMWPILYETYMKGANNATHTD